MQIELERFPRNPIILEGFPGFGFVATIVTDYLLSHLDVKPIGRIKSPDLPPLAIVHENKLIQPLEIFYNKDYNLLILQALTGAAGLEWEVSDVLISIYKKLKAKELISIEGIGTPLVKEEIQAYYYATNPTRAKTLQQIGIKPLKEGIILGVSGALLLNLPKDVNATFIFAETHSRLPDSRAAAKIVEVLDKYLGLKVEYEPLIKRAEEFEEKLRKLIEKAQQATLEKKKKEIAPYVG